MFSVKDRTWILDGGLATELERRGRDLSGALWSARLIRDDPNAILDVHRTYFEAGAEIVIAATYQVSQGNMVEEGLQLAIDARDQFNFNPDSNLRSTSAMVAASIGSYGAYLANGAEYTGEYDLDVAGLIDFHRERWEICQNSQVDLLACETIPSIEEAQALISLLRDEQKQAWFSFSCRDGERISDGTPIRECARLLDGEPMVAAIGVNCTRPVVVESLIREIRAVSEKPIVVYPNSGERWDGVRKCWVEGSNETVEAYVERAVRWRKAGATIIGGCCRTGPAHVRALRERLLG